MISPSCWWLNANTLSGESRNWFRSFLCLSFSGLIFLASGCVTPPVSYRVLPDAKEKIPSSTAVAIAPLDSEVSEISAGGVTEVREEWTKAVTRNLSQALSEESGYKVVDALDPALKGELDDIASLLRAVALNHSLSVFNPGLMRKGPQPLTYSLGPVDKVMDACQADALLFVFVRDSYASAGRKTLAALGVLAAGFTGVMIVPQLGTTVSSAALVQRDGTVLWFNLHGAASGDLRQMPGARATAKVLMEGLPKK
jgi:hypothetical protein